MAGIILMNVGIIFAVIGLALPSVGRSGPNKWIGIRTPATVGDPELWRIVHERSVHLWLWPGVLQFIGGVALLLANPQGEEPTFWAAGVIVAVTAVVIIVEFRIISRAKEELRSRKSEE